jgi:catalase
MWLTILITVLVTILLTIFALNLCASEKRITCPITHDFAVADPQFLRGFRSVPEEMSGEKMRKRSDSFSDHYSQARLFFRSQTKPEQQHIISAFAFELAKVQTKAIRMRMLGHLANVDPDLNSGVAEALGMKEAIEEIKPSAVTRDLPPSPSLSLLTQAKSTLQGRKIGVLITEGFDPSLLAKLRTSAKAEKASLTVIAPKIGGVNNSMDELVEADFPLSAAPSIFFDAVVILASAAGAKDLATQAAAVDWVSDANAHLKVLGHTSGAQVLLDRVGFKPDEGLVPLNDDKAVSTFFKTAKAGRIWAREQSLRRPG